MSFWDAVSALPAGQMALLAISLFVAFGFEFINGFHDTANAVASVIYTRTLRPYPAVLYSGVMNFLGVMLGGTAVAFGIVNLLPVELLVAADSSAALVMVLSLPLAGVAWNLGTWFVGIPVSSSHALIGSILGVGLANSLLSGHGIAGVNWSRAGDVGLALLLSPLIGFVGAACLMLLMKWCIKEPKLYVPPVGDDQPPTWVRSVLVATCGGVSYAHGSNDGQKGMGLILLILIGFLPTHYALASHHSTKELLAGVPLAREHIADRTYDFPRALEDLGYLEENLAGKSSLDELETAQRWEVRQAIVRVSQAMKAVNAPRHVRRAFTGATEFVPLWVIIGVALSLGIGTTVGYQRIVVTVAEKIGKTHLTYAQGAAAEIVAAATILLADVAHAPVSTTQVLSSGVAGTMAANGSGVHLATCKRILLAWVLTIPATVLLGGGLFAIGRWLVGY